MVTWVHILVKTHLSLSMNYTFTRGKKTYPGTEVKTTKREGGREKEGEGPQHRDCEGRSLSLCLRLALFLPPFPALQFLGMKQLPNSITQKSANC
jgi:hypothetical protein